MSRKNLSTKNNYKSNMAVVSQNWLDVLIPFSYEYNKRFSGSELSRLLNLPQRSVSRILLDLAKKGILQFEDKGKNKFYYFDLLDERSFGLLRVVENYKSFKFSKNSLLWKDLSKLLSFGTVVLFGSQVKGYSTESSDIDLVIFSRNNEKLKNVLRSLPKIQAQVVSFEIFEKKVFEKDVLALEIMKSHVVFGDFENFFNLCRRQYG